MRISDWSSDVCSSDLQAGPLQHGQVRGHGRLRQAAAFELAGADTHFQGMFLGREMLLGLFEPSQDVAAHRVGQCLDDEVDVHEGGDVNWVFSNYISINSDVSILSSAGAEPRAAGRQWRGFLL